MSRTNKRTVDDIRADIRAAYTKWRTMYKNGCNDPNYCDGVNLNLTRNHIVWYRNELEDTLQDTTNMPDEYYWKLPPKVEDNYMAKERVVAGRAAPASERVYKIDW